MLQYSSRIRIIISLLLVFVTECIATDLESCVECAAEGGSWQVNECQASPDCPIMDVGCCTNAECCATGGCRSPKEQHWISYGLDPIPCTTCCEETKQNGICVERSFISNDKDMTSNGYNVEKSYNCDDKEEFCPPCAACTTSDEDALKLLHDKNRDGQCSEQRCEYEKEVNYVQNPCNGDPNGCGCFCQQVNILLPSCPHLKEEFWKETNDDEMISPPSKADKCAKCVKEGGYWTADQCEKEYCPIADASCCENVECCMKSGCRSPSDSYWASYFESVSCETCCTEGDEEGYCLKRSSDGSEKEKSYYNQGEEYSCDEHDGFCPPCAQCTDHDEDELNKLSDDSSSGKCTASICEEEKSRRYVMNPCDSDPFGCGCWCQKVNLLLEHCPHTRDGYFPEERHTPPADQCINCVKTGGSWQEGQCEKENCPIMDVGCCTTPECCVTSGCRSPKEQHWISYGLDPIPCTICCEESEEKDICIERKYNDKEGPIVEYNSEKKVACLDSQLDCPPCAKCTNADEDNIQDLSNEDSAEKCTKIECEKEKGKKYSKDPCMSDPEGCSCWCTKVNEVLGDCVHLEDNFWEDETIGSYRYLFF